MVFSDPRLQGTGAQIKLLRGLRCALNLNDVRFERRSLRIVSALLVPVVPLVRRR